MSATQKLDPATQAVEDNVNRGLNVRPPVKEKPDAIHGIMADDPLVVEIKTEATRADIRVRATITTFRKLGELLIELKKRVPHGHFMEDVEKLTGIPHRSASRYMAMVYDKPRRATLKDAPAETYLRKCLNVTLDTENGQVANLPPAAPASHATVEVDAEEADPPARLPNWIPDDAERLWTLAKIELDKILPSDKSREKVLNEVIAYCHGRLDSKRDALAAIIATLPRLTKAEIKSLIETLNTRWT